MPTKKTVYVKDADLSLWERFENAVNQDGAADSVSSMLADAMRVYLDDGESGRVRQLHDRLRSLLETAEAQSCHVVAIFLDIRGFSTFASRGESFDIAFYLRSIYGRILDIYFPAASFFKPTGDGLLIIHELPPQASSLRSTLTALLTSCLELLDAFGGITKSDIMITGPVPDKLGIGIARGTATKLVSGGLVLDYTGRCLNLSARLMDKARPSGLVFHDDHAHELMDETLIEKFTRDHVCIRGISEDAPVSILISDDVVIQAADREPLPESRIQSGERSVMTFEEVKQLGSVFSFWLPRAPRSFEFAGVHINYPAFDSKGKSTDRYQTLRIPGDVVDDPEGFLVRISLKQVKDAIRTLPNVDKWWIIETKNKVTFTPFCAAREIAD
jgi:class 3 adenylate cyclase